MSSSGPGDERPRTVKRGAFPVRKADLEEAETFVPGPPGAADHEDVTPARVADDQVAPAGADPSSPSSPSSPATATD